MQSRQDQVQAQSSIVGRLSRALVAADPDLLDSPTRRTRSGTLAGLLVACLIIAGFTAYGYISPGGSTVWRKPGTLIVEKETGTRYVYLDGVLRPVLNYTSARLLLGERMALTRVSHKSLRTVGRGQPIGIPGAPDALPVLKSSSTTVWTACAIRASTTSGGSTTGTIVELSRSPSGSAISPSHASVVVTSDGSRYLIWSGRRHKMTEVWLSRVMGFDDAHLIPVTAAWLWAIAPGPDITPIRVPNAGKNMMIPGVPDAKAGQLFAFSGHTGAKNHYVLYEDGSFAPVTTLAAQILRGDPQRADKKLNTDPIELNPAVRAELKESTTPAISAELPESVPSPIKVGSGQALCLRFRPGGRGVENVLAPLPAAARPPEILSSGSPSSPAGGAAPSSPARGSASPVPSVSPLPSVSPTPTTPPGAGLAMGIAVDPQAGALVVAGGPGHNKQTMRYLVTNTGIRYPVATVKAAELLGYPKGQSVAIPPPLLELLPVGPTLDLTMIRG